MRHVPTLPLRGDPLCFNFKLRCSVFQLGAKAFEEGVLQHAACFWSKWASREVAFNKSLLSCLNKECVIFGVAPDVGEITDSLLNGERATTAEAHIDDVDQREVLLGSDEDITEVQRAKQHAFGMEFCDEAAELLDQRFGLVAFVLAQPLAERGAGQLVIEHRRALHFRELESLFDRNGWDAMLDQVLGIAIKALGVRSPQLRRESAFAPKQF